MECRINLPVYVNDILLTRAHSPVVYAALGTSSVTTPQYIRHYKALYTQSTELLSGITTGCAIKASKGAILSCIQNTTKNNPLLFVTGALQTSSIIITMYHSSLFNCVKNVRQCQNNLVPLRDPSENDWEAEIFDDWSVFTWFKHGKHAW